MGASELFGRETVAVVTAAEAAEADRAAREEAGIPERVLMENAGRSAALVLDRLFPEGRVVAAVGGGNNGGDALVLLRALRSWGREVAYVLAGSRAPDPALAHGFDVPAVPPGEAVAAFATAGAVVDGILGTGASGEPREPAATLIRAMNESGRPVVALDVPSGVDPTTGAVPGTAVEAAVTVTFGWPKQGLLFHPGRARCGRIVAVEIGFPPPADGWRPAGAVVTPAWAAARLPRRAPTAHKGTSGRVLVLAGSRGMAGAAALAGRAACRAGAGLVFLASAEANRTILHTLVPSALFLDRDDEAWLRRVARDADALLAGPGIGLDDGARRAFEQALEETAGRPALLDADALTLLAGDAERLRALAAERPLLVTPHPGEMARLTGRSTAAVVAAPGEAARALAEEAGCTVLLKGAPSVVAAPGEPILVNATGSSDVAKGGMGDQLAGLVAAFLGQGVPPRAAAALGVFYAGRAADLAGRGRVLLPDEVPEWFDRAFADPGAPAPPLGFPFVTFDQPPPR